MTTRAQRDTGSLVISLLLVVAGLVTLFDTTSYADTDSQIFPRAAAVMLILSAGASAAVWFIRPQRSDGFGAGDWWRRLVLVGSMLLAALAMPYTGFLATSLLVFAGGLVSGMHERWGRRELILYPIISAIIAVAFYVLFKYALYVPLP